MVSMGIAFSALRAVGKAFTDLTYLSMRSPATDIVLVETYPTAPKASVQQDGLSLAFNDERSCPSLELVSGEVDTVPTRLSAISTAVCSAYPLTPSPSTGIVLEKTYPSEVSVHANEVERQVDSRENSAVEQHLKSSLFFRDGGKSICLQRLKQNNNGN